jgi:predicted nuclease of predicted toxin-antitoxin system
MKPPLLADENFPLVTIKALVAAGYDIQSIATDHPGLDDRAVLALARRTGRRLLTFDSDFGDLVFFCGEPPPPAIVYFRLHPIRADVVLAVTLRALAETPDGYFAVAARENTRLRPFAPRERP